MSRLEHLLLGVLIGIGLSIVLVGIRSGDIEPPLAKRTTSIKNPFRKSEKADISQKPRQPAAAWAVVSLNQDGAVLAKFVRTANGVRLLGLAKVPNPASPASASQSLDFAPAVKALGLDGAPVDYCYPLGAIFTRHVKLPSVGEDQLSQVITFEAQQNIPYPLGEVHWWYQIEGGRDDTQFSVTIFAVHKTIAEKVDKSLKTAGLRPRRYDAPGNSVHALFQRAFPQPDGTKLILCEGDEHLLLVFQKINWPLFNRGIVKSKIRSHDTSESQKDPAADNSLDPAKLAARQVAEVERSIQFYVKQQGGERPTSAFLLGSGKSVEPMRAPLAKQLNVPVQNFDPLKLIETDTSIDVAGIKPMETQLAEIVGLALSGGSGAVEREKTEPKMSVGAMVLLAISMVFGLLLYRRIFIA